MSGNQSSLEIGMLISQFSKKGYANSSNNSCSRKLPHSPSLLKSFGIEWEPKVNAGCIKNRRFVLNWSENEKVSINSSSHL